MAVSHRKVNRFVTQVSVGRIKGKRLGIVQNRRDAHVRQVPFQSIAFFGSNDVEVINMIAVTSNFRRHDVSGSLQQFIIPRRNLATRFGPGRQVRQLNLENCSLEAIQTTVDAFHDVVALAAMTSEGGHPIGERGIIAYNAAGVAIRSEVFPGIERKRGSIAKGPDQFPFVPGEMCLGAIFNDPEPVRPRDRHNRIHVSRLSVKMHWNDAHRPGSDFGLDQGGIDRECLLVRVAKHHPPASLGDCLRSGNPGMSRGDHLVTRFYPQTAHSNVQSVGAVGAGNAVAHPDRFRPSLLEGFDVGSADEGGLRDNILNRFVNLRLDILVLSIKVNERDFHEPLRDGSRSWRCHKVLVVGCVCRETRLRFGGELQCCRRASGCERLSAFLPAGQTTQKTGGVAHINTRFVDVFGNYCASANDDLVADGHGKDSCVRSDADVTSDCGEPPEAPISHGRTSDGEGIVNKHGAMRNEAVITDGHHIANKDVGLNPATFADACSALDLNKRTDGTVVSDHTSV